MMKKKRKMKMKQKIKVPVLEEVSESISDVSFFNIDVDEARNEAEEFSVMSIPLLVVLKDGKEVSRQVGFQPKENVEQFIKDAIK